MRSQRRPPAIDVIRPTASAKRVSVQTDFGKGPKLIHADGARLQQVVWNVLANAVKFTPTGGRIDVRVVEQNALIRADSRYRQRHHARVSALRF